jgi:hypothetical protein
MISTCQHASTMTYIRVHLVCMDVMGREKKLVRSPCQHLLANIRIDHYSNDLSTALSFLIQEIPTPIGKISITPRLTYCAISSWASYIILRETYRASYRHV